MTKKILKKKTEVVHAGTGTSKVPQIVTMPTMVLVAQPDLEFAIHPSVTELLGRVDYEHDLLEGRIQQYLKQIEEIKNDIEFLKNKKNHSPQRKQDIVRTDISLAGVPNLTGKAISISSDNTTAWIPQTPVPSQNAGSQA